MSKDKLRAMRKRRRQAAEAPHYSTIDVRGGFVIGCEQGDRTTYAGRDCFWLRDKNAATPFANRAEARAIVQDLNDEVSETIRRTRNAA